jgi:hypothetical protein
VEQERTSIAMQRLGKHIPSATNTHATTEETVSKHLKGKHTKIGVLLETVFSVRSVQSDYNRELRGEALPLVMSKFRPNVALPMLVQMSP